MCCVRLVAERRADAWRVDQDNAAAENRRWIEDIHSRNPQAITRVPLFGYETRKLVLDVPRPGYRLLLCWPRIEETDVDRGSTCPVNEGGYSGKRDDAGWQQRLAEKGV